MATGAGRYQGQALNSINPLRYASIFLLSFFRGLTNLASSRDTVLFPAYSWTVIRFVADNPYAELVQDICYVTLISLLGSVVHGLSIVISLGTCRRVCSCSS